MVIFRRGFVHIESRQSLLSFEGIFGLSENAVSTSFAPGRCNSCSNYSNCFCKEMLLLVFFKCNLSILWALQGFKMEAWISVYSYNYMWEYTVYVLPFGLLNPFVQKHNFKILCSLSSIANLNHFSYILFWDLKVNY